MAKQVASTQQTEKLSAKTTGEWLFISDLDGTLLNDRKQISPADLQALQRLQAQETIVAFATGRSDFSVSTLLRGLAPGLTELLPVDYIIISTGAGVLSYPEWQVTRKISLLQAEVVAILEVLAPFNLDFMIHRPIPDTKFFLYRQNNMDNPDFLRRLQIYRDYAEELTPMSLATLEGATEVLCILPASQGPAIAEQVAAKLPQFSVIRATSPLDGRSLWLEIFAADASKSKAALWLAEQLGIPRDRVCAVGNDYNDEDLLHWAGRSFVVGNSPKSLCQRFCTVADNNEGGVAEAAGRWLSNR